MMSYNGFANYATWNVALWLQNDEALYRMARGMTSYAKLASRLQDMGSAGTPDNVAWDSAELDTDTLDAVLEEL
jgi:hypothetical protein